MDNYGAILGASFYRNGKKVFRDCGITLPSVTFKTAEHAAMGTIELPMPGQIEAMEFTVTPKGYDPNIRLLGAPEACDLEARFVQNKAKEDAGQAPVGCRAYMRGTPKTIPGGDVTTGEVAELETTYAVTRYQLFVGGTEVCLIDQLKGICRVNGKDYAADINNLL